MNAPLYELRGVERIEAGRCLLAVPELVIDAGGITAVVGPNGAGKSTLLRVLALLDPPEAGTVALRGAPVARRGTALTLQRRRVTMVGQTPYLFQGSVFDNVALGLKLRGVPRRERRERVAQALRLVELPGIERQRARTLSGGEVRRVAIARALAIETPVLLLDEPFANVDLRRVERLERLVRDVNRERDVSVIFSTHNLTQAHALAGRVIDLAAGRVLPERHDNLFSGTAARVDDGSMALALDSGARLALPAGTAAGPLSCTLRPEAIALRLAGEAGDEVENRLPGRIVRMGLRGDRAWIRVDTGTLFRVELPLDEVRARGLTLGQEVRLCFPASALRAL